MYEAWIISLLLFTDGFVKAVLARSDFNTPVFSNFFLKRFSALSIDSFSLMLIISIFLMFGLQRYTIRSELHKSYFKIDLEMTSFCISEVPSPIVQSFASR